MVFTRTIAAAVLLQMLAMGPAHAHPGKLDGNGCHYETASGKPKPYVNAPVKKSRENLCHDESSTNYKTMAECPSSGGRAPG